MNTDRTFLYSDLDYHEDHGRNEVIKDTENRHVLQWINGG